MVSQREGGGGSFASMSLRPWIKVFLLQINLCQLHNLLDYKKKHMQTR